MASVRRTLSPMPHTGTSLGAEACSVASPLSRPSSSNSSNKVQTLLLGLFSTKSSRPHDRSKSKGQVWRRAIFHYLICFCFGIFVGLVLFVSMNLSEDYQSEDQDFRFTKILVVPGNATSVAGRPPKTNDGVPIEPYLSKWDMSNGTFNDTIVLPQSFDRDSYKVFDKLLIIVTPTYARPFQAYYLNRLAHTLKLVPSPLLWIVVEMDSQSAETADTLRRSGVMYRHLVCSKNLTEIKDRSLHQRNVALAHIETHQLDGIVYFADDNNICSTELFEQMRQIRRFGTWTVAKLVPDEGQIVLEGPVCNGTQVVGWHTDDNVTRRFRRFHVQMSGFAFNSTVLWDPKRWHRPTLEPIRMIDTVKELFQVSEFVEQVVEDESQMEGLPQDCSKVMIWQPHIESPFSYSYPTEWLMKNNLDAVAPLVQEF